MPITGMLFDVKRFAVHDGPGVRTTLFLKGCPLRCRWCHNPESLAPQPQLAYYEHKCLHCGECVAACPAQAHALADGKHVFDRSKCRACGACEAACLGSALRLYGRRVTVDEAVQLAVEDRDFFGANGGVTLSGGEPLMQPAFCHELLRRLKQLGIHTAVDTCGQVGWDALERVIPVTDLFLFDFKHANSEEHRKLTGQGNALIVANLRRLSESGAAIEVRVPLIPGCNDTGENLHATGELLGGLRLERVKVLPYNVMARSKYAALGMADTMPHTEPQDDDSLRQAVAMLRHDGSGNARPGG